MLKAKTLMLQQQLQQSHARCRRAEQVNGKWRTQLGALRQREKEGWDALQSGLKKAERAEELQRQNQRLRESVKERGDELDVEAKGAVEGAFGGDEIKYFEGEVVERLEEG